MLLKRRKGDAILHSIPSDVILRCMEWHLYTLVPGQPLQLFGWFEKDITRAVRMIFRCISVNGEYRGVYIQTNVLRGIIIHRIPDVCPYVEALPCMPALTSLHIYKQPLDPFLNYLAHTRILKNFSLTDITCLNTIYAPSVTHFTLSHYSHHPITWSVPAATHVNIAPIRSCVVRTPTGVPTLDLRAMHNLQKLYLEGECCHMIIPPPHIIPYISLFKVKDPHSSYSGIAKSLTMYGHVYNYGLSTDLTAINEIVLHHVNFDSHVPVKLTAHKISIYGCLGSRCQVKCHTLDVCKSPSSNMYLIGTAEVVLGGRNGITALVTRDV